MTADRLMGIFVEERKSLVNPQAWGFGFPDRNLICRSRVLPTAHYEAVWWIFELARAAKEMAPRVSPEGQVLIPF